MIRVMITGHRPERLKGREAEILEWINNTINSLTSEDECITGCAKGVDTLFATAAINKHIPLVCAFPYKHKLSEPEQQMHDYAKEVHWETEEWYKACYLNRDKWMVNRADIVLVVWDGIPKGGTYYTMEYAKEKGKRILLFPWNKDDNSN